ISAGSSRARDETDVTVDLEGFDSGPMVFTQVASHNGTDAVTSRVTSKSSDSFQFRMQEEEALDGNHATEQVDWIAIEDVDGGPLDITTMGAVNHNFSAAEFGAIDGEVGLLAAMQTFNGSDTAALRYEDLTGSSVRIKVEEERSNDAEVAHLPEEIAVLTAETGLYELA
ncbi:MAG: hypothetical protein AAF899_13785, partial [Pseudomonadota bacterium]